MRTWLVLFCGLLIWAVHFFALYGIGEFVGSTTGSRLTIGAITFCALATAAGLAFWLRSAPKPTDEFGLWLRRSAQCGLALSAVAVIWQALPIFFREPG